MTWWLDTPGLNLIEVGRQHGYGQQCAVGSHLSCPHRNGRDCECRCHVMITGMLEEWKRNGDIP